MRNRVWFFGVLFLFLCVDLFDHVVKLEKDVSIVGVLPYAAFVGPLMVLPLIALRTDSLLFHRIFAVYSLLALLVLSATTLVPITN